MKKILVVIAFLTFGLTYAQNNRAESKVISQFQTAFNASNYKAIYNMYSKDKQNTRTLEDIKVFFERVKNSKGDIVSLTFSNTDKNYSIYKAVFSKTTGEVVVKLNNKGKADILSTRSTQR